MKRISPPGWDTVVWAAACGFVFGAITVAVLMQLPPRRAEAAQFALRPAPLEGSALVVPKPDDPDAPATPRIELDPVKDLRARHLTLPVEGATHRDLSDSFNDARSAGKHEAIDILAPRNTPVVATEDGRIARLFTSRLGGLTIYEFDPTTTYCYYYAHLDRYGDDLQQGQNVRRGQTIGYVGTTGNAPKNTPHLHFAIFKLTGEKQWWKGTPIDPYAVLQ
jgi:murein DD-endopeptidase MepM/ murein hydrolase activator NlpD